MVEDGGEEIGVQVKKINWEITSKIRNGINNSCVTVSFLLFFFNGRYRNQAKYLLKLIIVLSFFPGGSKSHGFVQLPSNLIRT